jgi:hypothetical protein
MQSDSPRGASVLTALVMPFAIVVAVSLATGATASAQAAGARALPRVYVFTQVAKAGQPVPPDQAGRLESVKDLREALRRKPGLLEVVDAPQPTDVTIEVTRRDAPSATERMVTVELRMAARNYAREFQSQAATWKDAAALLTELIRRWVNETFDAPLPAPYERAAIVAASTPAATARIIPTTATIRATTVRMPT